MTSRRTRCGGHGPARIPGALPNRRVLERHLADAWPEVAALPDRFRVVRAPGRVNLIGEHTDYNEGFVLPVAISLETRIAFVPTDDRRVELVRLDTGERDGFDLAAIGERRDSWIDYPAGVAWALAERGVSMRGMRGMIASNVPIGSGLSSSAAMELAMAWALSEASPPPLGGMELAAVAQRAENGYVGVMSGLMDPFASANGREDAALLLDCRSLQYRPVPLPLERVELVVCDSQAPRELASSAYNERRAQCEEIVSALQARGHDVRSLRDTDLGLLDELRGTLDPVTIGRGEHVIGENERVLATGEALVTGELDRVGELFAESHASLRDLYEVSSPELDALVEIAARVEGVVGARMTGAGFGGCTVNLVEPWAVRPLEDAIAQDYPGRAGRQAVVHRVRPARGAGEVSDDG